MNPGSKPNETIYTYSEQELHALLGEARASRASGGRSRCSATRASARWMPISSRRPRWIEPAARCDACGWRMPRLRHRVFELLMGNEVAPRQEFIVDSSDRLARERSTPEPSSATRRAPPRSTRIARALATAGASADAGAEAPTTPSSGMPEASRFAPGSGSARGRRPAPTARGSAPTQASVRASSPRRKRCARTPPVARPLAGNSVKSETLAVPASVPARRSRAAGDRHDDGVGSPRLDDGEAITRSPSVRRMPAMPPAERSLRSHRRRVEAQQLGVARDEDELRAVGRRRGADDPIARPSAR